ncbi:MAG: tRNA (adenosine(37)-N6)-threonylcarbamoyltransferase complex transferase subunit TsaD [Alphaproteobacteria bacterium]|nr:tRNA (adenosine(37)-N6)-threonylcarbamoyltransferase complex transferase subunit TsaD [Alphaproteobacteria bacterium]
MIVLGIETSCDETAAAVVSAETGVLSNIVLSQTTEHVKYGGVVPEIAARAHLGYLHGLIEKAMAEAKLDFGDLDGVAATCGPGLIGGLMIGMIAGKSIAVAAGKPFIAVNHLEGHALTPRLTDGLDFPYLLLLISGGHTQILVAEDVGRYRRWGTTLDDACGECFDKSAKLMGLPWPGGPHLEKLAAQCTNTAEAEKRFPLPRPMKGRKELDFSFSGLKTAVRIHAQSLAEDEKPALAWALQSAIADILAERCGRALTRFREEYRPLAPAFVVSGGVAANLTIRSALEAMAVSQSAKLYAPPLNLCSDNAAMIAWAGVERLKRGMTDPLDFKARPRWPLDPDAEPRQGAGVKA